MSDSTTSSPGFLSRIHLFWAALRPITRTRVRFGGTGFLIGFVIATALFTRSCEVEAPAIQVVKSTSGAVHPAIAGRPVLAKAVLEPRPGRLLKYSWDFGDGSDPVGGIVSNPYAVSASHLYPDAEVGQKFTATLTVTDTESGDETTGEYRIKFVEPTTTNKEAIALDDGLWQLHATLERTNDPVVGETGLWDRTGYHKGITAMAALAFQVNGFDGRAERRDTPYAETVDRALTHLLSNLQVMELGDGLEKFDSDGNGKALTVASDKALYEQPLITMALVASRTPKAIAGAGPEGVIGRSYRDIVVDLLDFLAFAQIDEGQTGRGGWRYHANDTSGADMSVTQWPVLAFMAAEEVWNIEAPGFVRSELKHFLRAMQGNDGGFGYSVASTGMNNGLTGAGIIAHAFVGTDHDDPAVAKARGYIATNWDTANIGDYYNMYAVMKAAKLTDPEIKKFGEHDWHEEYVEALYGSQLPNGAWSGGGQWASGTLRTAWPTLILSQDIFAKGSPLALVWKIAIAVGILIVIAVIVVLVLFILSRRGGQAGAEGDTPEIPLK